MSRPPVSLITTDYGQPALQALHEAVRAAKQSDPLATVSVIVPSNFVGLASRRALASGDVGPIVGDRPGMAGVTFLTVYRLAELLGAGRLAAQHRRPVSTPVIAAAVRSSLADQPGYFARVAEHPTTERRLVEAHRELSDLDDDLLDHLAGLDRAASEVVRLHRAVRARLRTDWYLEQDLLGAAVERIEAEPQSLSELGDVVVYLPDRFSPARARLLNAVAERSPITVIAALTGETDADSSVRTGLAGLGVEPLASRTSHAPTRGESRPDIHITTVSDADDEVRQVVRGILDASRDGVPFDRMAVVWGSPNPYVRLLHDHLEAAGLPRNGTAVATLAESVAGRVLRRLLALPDRQYRREDLIGLVSSAPLRWRGGSLPSRAWDQISRDAGVVKGAGEWDVRLTRLIDDAHGDIERMGQDPEYEWRVQRLARTAKLGEQLRSFVADLAQTLDRGAANTTWRRQANWCKRLLTTYLAISEDWPDHERQAADRLEGVLDRLGSLDAVESTTTLSIFRRTLDLELDGGLGRVGSFGNGVLLGPASVATGVPLDRLWVLGMSEGSFPGRPREDSLLPDRVRRAVGVLALRGDRAADQHRDFLAALASVDAGGRVDLLHPRGDLRQSNERAPSRWLVDVVHQRTGDLTISGADLDHIDAPWLHHVASFAAGVTEAPFAATTQEYELQTLVAALRDTGSIDHHPLLEAVPGLAAGASLQRLRSSSRFTRFDGNLAGLEIEPPGTTRPTSATALETWARCPHQFFVRYLLGVYPLETPELRLRIDPLTKGSLLHEILEEFVQQAIDAGDGPVTGWPAGSRERLREVAAAHFSTTENRGLTGEALYWRRDRVLLGRDLDEFILRDTERRDGRLAAVGTEVGFGLRDRPPISLRVGDDRTIAVRGSIDLVDETPEGDLVVIDYKTGKYHPMKTDDPHKGGTKLQLVLYAIAARAALDRPDASVESHYWHIRPDAGYKTAGYAVTDEIERDVLDTVGGIVEGIAAGVFPQHPDDTTRSQYVSCAYCDPDGLGVTDARRRFVRMAADPRLADYLALVEPNLVPARLDLEPADEA